jgi:hypothetical protein
MTDTEPKIDFAAIDYPTDKLTVKQLRQRTPHAFDVEPRPEWGTYIVTDNRSRFRRMTMDNVLGHVVDSERQLAEWAFKKALGQPVPDWDLSSERDTTMDNLSSEYIKWGLARGEHEANEMLRGIEAQATAQARQHGGRPLP